MRCAYCHDQLELDHYRCDGCGTLLHLDCSTSLPVCPTLGCAVAQPAPPPIPIHLRPSPRRLAVWAVLGVLLPLIAFALDAGMQVDPLIWGKDLLTKIGAHGAASPRPLPYVHLALIWGGAALSALGLLLLAFRQTRASLPLLSLGVVFSGAHALAFVPLIPLSLIGILFAGLGLLGFLPFVTFWVFLDAAKRARSLLHDDEVWAQSLLVSEDKRTKRRLLLVLLAFLFAGACYLAPRPVTLHSPAAWDLSRVDLGVARRDALDLLQADTPKAEEVVANRLRERFESYGRTTTPSYPDVTQGQTWVKLEFGSGVLEPESTSEAPLDSDASHWVWIMADEDELPPTPPGTRSVEFAPGVWSQWQHTPAEEGHEPELQHLPLW